MIKPQNESINTVTEPSELKQFCMDHRGIHIFFISFSFKLTEIYINYEVFFFFWSSPIKNYVFTEFDNTYKRYKVSSGAKTRILK